MLSGEEKKTILGLSFFHKTSDSSTSIYNGCVGSSAVFPDSLLVFHLFSLELKQSGPHVCSAQ